MTLMISFFRKLRLRFLGQNKVTQYLMYALGEILLVVIGILIALQVNTWNEERQQKAQVSPMPGRLSATSGRI